MLFRSAEVAAEAPDTPAEELVAAPEAAAPEAEATPEVASEVSAEIAPEVAEVAAVAEDSAPAEAADESDDHTEEEREAHEDHSADYSELSEDELLAEAARVLREVPIADARVPMLALRNTLLPRLDEERQAALDKFVEEGGNAIDFHFEQKAREKFYETYNEFKKRRGAWKAEQERALAVNLDLKKALVDRKSVV